HRRESARRAPPERSLHAADHRRGKVLETAADLYRGIAADSDIGGGALSRKEFHQTVWTDALLQDWLRILELAVAEDLGATGDCTTNALVPADARGRAEVVARSVGVLAGEPIVGVTAARFSPELKWTAHTQDGQKVTAGQSIGVLEGPAAPMLAA